MRNFALLVGLIAVVPTNQACAQSPVSSRAGLSGQVVVNGAATPVPNSLVQLFELIDSAPEIGGTKPGGATRSVQADANGRFEFTSLEPGAYRVVAVNGDFVVDSYSRQVVRISGGETRVVTLRLGEGGKVLGRVVDHDGRSIRGAIIRPVRADGLLTGLSRDIRTTETGDFVVSPLAPGQYFFLAAPASQSSTVPVDEILAETYYPSTQDRSKARLVDVEEGKAVRDVLITLESTRGFTVSGSVADNRGQPMAQAQVGLSNGRVTRYVQTQDEGRFVFFGVAKGPYTLVLMSPPQTSAVAGRTVMVTTSVASGFKSIEVVDADLGAIRLVQDSQRQ